MITLFERSSEKIGSIHKAMRDLFNGGINVNITLIHTLMDVGLKEVFTNIVNIDVRKMTVPQDLRHLIIDSVIGSHITLFDTPEAQIETDGEMLRYLL